MTRIEMLENEIIDLEARLDVCETDEGWEYLNSSIDEARAELMRLLNGDGEDKQVFVNEPIDELD